MGAVLALPARERRRRGRKARARPGQVVTAREKRRRGAFKRRIRRELIAVAGWERGGRIPIVITE